MNAWFGSGALPAGTIAALAALWPFRVRWRRPDRHRMWDLVLQDGSNAHFEVGVDGVIRYASPNLVDLTGAQASSWVGRSILEIAAERDRPPFQAAFEQLASGSEETLRLTLAGNRDRGWPESLDIVARSLLSDPDVGAIQVAVGPGEGLGSMRGMFSQLFEHTLNGVAIHEIVTDSDGVPIDYVFLEVNPGFERATGLKRPEVLGRRVTEILPDVGKDGFIETYGRVALTGEPVTFERYASDLGRHYQVRAFSLGGGRFVVSFNDISDRVERQRAVESEERRLRSMLDGGWDVVALVDRAGSLTWVSQSVEEVLGRDPEALLGTKMSDYVHPADLPVLNKALRDAVVSRGEPLRFVARARHADGGYRWLESSASNMLDTPEVQGLVVVARDVTETRDTMQALRDSEARYRAVAEVATDLILIMDEAGGIKYVNGAAAPLLGWDPEDLVGRSLEVLLPPEARDEMGAALGRHLETGIPRIPEDPVEVWAVRKDGEEVLLEVAFAEYDERGARHFTGIARDVTERRRRELERTRLFRAIEQVAELVVVTDPEGRIEYVNPAFETITGYTREEVLGRNLRLLKSGQQSLADYQELWDTLLAGETWSGTFINRRKDGSTYRQQAVISPVRDPGGAVVNFVSVARDVTRETELEDQLRQAQKLEAIGHLTGGVAHDLNNVLSVIIANGQMLLGELGEATPESWLSAEEIVGAANRAGKMVRQLLSFGRKTPLERRNIRLADVIDEVGSLVGRLLPESIELRISVVDEIPLVRADRGAVEQMVMNLVTNARDAMPAGGRIDIEIGVGDKVPGGVEGSERGDIRRHVFVRVTDHGQGMHPETLARAFEPFYTTKEVGKGTGLGLSMTYGLMQQHDGFVELASRPGQGAKATLWFPAVSTEEEADAAPAPPPLRPGDGETILVVEDEEPLRRTVARVLTRFGYRVVVAENGAHALDELRRADRDVDLVLCDMVMPTMGGLDFARALKAEGYRIPILLTSGYSAEERRSSGTRLGGRPFLPKPWTVETLLAAIRSALETGAMDDREAAE